MRRIIKLPASQLSALKEVNIDLDMTGRHYALLASCEGQLPEDVALSILKDLVEEDANLLTLAEERYLFTLVKINSLENDYTVDAECMHKKKDGKPCGNLIHVDLHLSDGDLNDTPSDYKPPKIIFKAGDKETGITEKEYTVIPPPMKEESRLYSYFLTERNVSHDDIADNKQLSFDYTYLRALLHLVDPEGNRLVKSDDKFGDLFKYLDINKYQTINKLYDAVIEVNKFGVQNKVYEVKCKECGGTSQFQIPLLYGLLD